jgi:hypothetical protein
MLCTYSEQLPFSERLFLFFVRVPGAVAPLASSCLSLRVLEEASRLSLRVPEGANGLFLRVLRAVARPASSCLSVRVL